MLVTHLKQCDKNLPQTLHENNNKEAKGELLESVYIYYLLKFF